MNNHSLVPSDKLSDGHLLKDRERMLPRSLLRRDLSHSPAPFLPVCGCVNQCEISKDMGKP